MCYVSGVFSVLRETVSIYLFHRNNVFTSSCVIGFLDRQEFSGLDLGDTRLNDRLVSIADALAAQPMSPISTACEDWSAVSCTVSLTMKTCLQKRFLSLTGNERLNGCGPRSVSLRFKIQPISTDHPSTQGLGPISTKSQKNFSIGLVQEAYVGSCTISIGSLASVPIFFESLPVHFGGVGLANAGVCGRSAAMRLA